MDFDFTKYKEELKTRDKNLRRTFIKELYQLYVSDKEKLQRKKANWKNYVNYLKETKQKDSPTVQNHYRKSRHFIVELPEGRFAQRLWSIKTEDLPWCISQIKNDNRTFAWLFWSITQHDKKNT